MSLSHLVLAAAVDPDVVITVVFVSWVLLFALAVAGVVRHERSRDAVASRAGRRLEAERPPSAEGEKEGRPSDTATPGS